MNLKVTEFDATTQETVVRDLSDDEIAQYKADEDLASLKKIQLENQFKAKLIAEAKLAALGLSLDDLKALGL